MSPQFLPAVRVRLRVSADLSGGVLGGVVGGVVGGVTACLLVATSASASTGGAVPMMGRSSQATSVLALADVRQIGQRITIRCCGSVPRKGR